LSLPFLTNILLALVHLLLLLLLPLLAGKSDGYCKFDIIPSGIIGARTSTIRRSLNPQWHEQFVG
jgi:hypothetical protein